MRIQTRTLAIALLIPALASAQMDMPGMNMPMGSQMHHDHAAMQPEAAPPPAESPIVPDLLHDLSQRKPVSLDEWYAIAERQSPSLTAARARVRSLQAEAKQAGLAPNPEIGYEGDQIRGGSFHGGEQGVYIAQRFVLGGKLNASRTALQAQAHAAELAVQQAEATLRAEVGQRFYAALRAQAEVAVRSDLLAVAHDTVLTQRTYANTGIVDTPDVLAAEVEEETAAVEAVRAQRNYLAAFRTLAATAGADAMEDRALAGDLTALPADDAEALAKRATTESPAIRRMEALVAANAASAVSEGRAAIPDITVKAGEQWNGEQLNTPTSHVGAQSFASASLNLPLWNRNQFGVAAANVRVEEARAEVARTRLAIQARTASLQQSVAALRFAADRYRTQILPRATQALEMYRKGYGNMQAPYSQVLLWQRRSGELRIAYLDLLMQLWSAHVSLENYGLGDSVDGGASPLRMIDDRNGVGNMIEAGNGNMIERGNGSMIR